MIKVTVMYPNKPDTKFDIDYYCNTHIPLVSKLLGDALISCTVDSGIAGGAPDEAPVFIAIGSITFESLETFHNAFGPNGEEIMADLVNFTDIVPLVQVSEIKL